MTPPVYRFLPWARRGLGVGVIGGGGTLPARGHLPVLLDVNGVPVSVGVETYGPGDVTGIDRRTVLRTEPAAGATDFEPNYLAAVEFDPPDLPWMFTPAGAEGDQLRPWLVLVVVEKQPGVTLRIRADAPLPVLTITPPAVPRLELPDLAQSWAWAHGQVLEEAGTAAADLDADDRTLSRLLCPRRLKPETRYLACVVPAFDAGVASGLGGPPSQAAVEPAWELDDRPELELPVYHFWEFATAVEDDVESMARRLHGPERAPTRLGERLVHTAAGHPSFAAPPLPPAARAVTTYGALRPARTTTAPDDPVQDPALTERVADVVGDRDTGTLPPPLYGEGPADQHTLPDSPGWQREVNTEVAHRVAAGLGAEVVRLHQEELVHAAWEQLGQVREANELATRARLAAAVLDRLLTRHLAVRAPGRLLPLAGPMLAATAIPVDSGGGTRPSVAAHLATTSLPVGATSASYRRLASGQRQLVARATREGGLLRGRGLVGLVAEAGAPLVEPTPSVPDGVVALRDRGRLTRSSDGSVSLAALGLPGRTAAEHVERLRPVERPHQPIPRRGELFPPAELGAVLSQLTGRGAVLRRGEVPIKRRPRPVTDERAVRAFAAVVSRVAERMNTAGPQPSFVGVDATALATHVLERLEPHGSVRRRVGAMVGGQGASEFDPFQGVTALPSLGEPAYGYLEELEGGWLLPKAEGLEPDTALLLRTNTPFTTAFLVGMNHEMNGELLWRGYPTDQRGTPFRQFWDRLDDAPDITPVHSWEPDSGLATAGLPPGAAGGEQIVLLLRGRLLRRYPDMVVYATTGTRQAPGSGADPRGRPVFVGSMTPDIQLVGFPLTEPELAAAEWWFVLEQQLTAPRFGLDTTGPVHPTRWADASWEWSGVPFGGHLNVDASPVAILGLAGPPGSPLSADHVAANLLQRPVRVALHRDRLLLPTAGS